VPQIVAEALAGKSSEPKLVETNNQNEDFFESLNKKWQELLFQPHQNRNNQEKF
jgi:hypothetical protein